MKKTEAVFALVLVLSSGMLIIFAPGSLSMIMTAIMCVVLLVGYMCGIRQILEFGNAFKTGRYNISKSKKVQTEKNWYAVSQNENFFANNFLDVIFRKYVEQITSQEVNGKKIYSDIEEEINVDIIENHAFNGVISQIPNTLTGLGILGTFTGLLLGIGNLGFTSIAAAMGNLQTLLNGINVAFYTSIAGVILSIIFNFMHKLAWNMTDKEMYLFYKDFHEYVIPSAEEQEKRLNQEYHDELISILKGLDSKTTEKTTQKSECVINEKTQKII